MMNFVLSHNIASKGRENTTPRSNCARPEHFLQQESPAFVYIAHEQVIVVGSYLISRAINTVF